MADGTNGCQAFVVSRFEWDDVGMYKTNMKQIQSPAFQTHPFFEDRLMLQRLRIQVMTDGIAARRVPIW